MAGIVLGVESVPDGLASGLLAGLNPVAGLYGYLFGMVGGVLFTSTAFMTIQATGAMSIIVADVGIGGRDDPTRSLVTLSLVTGVVMLLAGVLRLGRFLRFVSNSVMTGFITAVGVNIVLGQLGNLTGYAASGGGRLARTFNLLINPDQIDIPTFTVGIVTIVGIVLLQRTRLGALGLVVAVIAGSALAAVLDAFGHPVAIIGDIADVPRGLPLPTLPAWGEIGGFIIPAASLAFVGLVQGAGVSAGFPNRDGTPTDASQDFIGQGAGNIVSGVFQGMPVGGSMSASAIVTQAGGQSRAAILYAGAVMAFVVIVLASAVELVAMPSLAGLLIVVGIGTIKPAKVLGVARTGSVPLAVMSITFVLTIVIPLQYAVVIGVALSVLLFVIGQSSNLTLRRIEFLDDGRMRETDPPAELGPNEVVVIQPYGPLFFATATALHDRLPTVTALSRRSVVILRVRGADEAGATLIEVLRNYATSLRDQGSKLVIVTDNVRLVAQLHDTAVADVVEDSNIYRSTEYLGETVRRAHVEALAWTADGLPPDDEQPTDDAEGAGTT